MAAVSYRFLPWSRRGLADETKEADRGKPLPPRIASEAALILSGGLSAGISLETQGPGDVTGFDAGAVIGTFPRADVTDAEPENLVSIEFDLPELPWLLTPAQAVNDRLRPWLMLVVVDASGPDAIAEPVSLPTRHFATIDLTAAQVAGQLPELAQSWCWAHSQLLTDMPGNSAASLADAPLLNLSRIISPRRLEPMKSYRACLVPAFDQGVERGLGRTPDRSARLKPAWDIRNPKAITLPLYYHWTFSTGPAGDFEALARALKALSCPATIGQAELDLADAFPAQSGSRRAPIAFHGVLLPGNGTPPGLKLVSSAVQNSLLRATARSDGLSLPIYGGAHAQTASLAANSPIWLAEINLDPRMRIAAGLGAEVVRANQDVFVQACWEQVGAIDEVNRLMDRGRLSVEALGRFGRRITALSPARSLTLVGPLLDRIRLAEGTVQTAISRSSLPDGRFAAPFRRLANPRRSAVRLAGKRLGVDRNSGLARMDSRGTAHFANDGFRMPVLSGSQPQSARKPAADSRISAAIRALRVSARLGARDNPHPSVPFALDEARTVLERGIAPQRTVAARIGSMIETGRDTIAETGLSPLLVAPELPEPAFLRLAAADPTIFLPRADDLPENTITLLESHTRFIEAFMVGLNHEMNRELSWRGFPVDMRGTPFRHFWDRGEDRPDILPIAQWPLSSPLGSHGGPSAAPGEIVLLARTPLFSRFSGSIMAAWRGEMRDGHNMLKTDPVHGDDPANCDYLRATFQGKLSADLVFAGFPLTCADIEAGAGWHIVIEQQWTEPRFGFETDTAGHLPSLPTRWLDAQWSDVGVIPGQHIRTDGRLSRHAAQGITLTANAGHFAAAALKRPFRIAIPARHLLAAERAAT